MLAGSQHTRTMTSQQLAGRARREVNSVHGAGRTRTLTNGGAGSGAGWHAEAAASPQPVLMLADAGDITGRNAVPEVHNRWRDGVHRLYGAPEVASRRAQCFIFTGIIPGFLIVLI